MAGVVSRAQSADIPAMVVDVDEQTGKKTFRFHRYDRAETLSGKVYEAHPAWASDLGVKRGTPLAKIARISYVKFNETFNGGGLRIPSSQLRSLVYYEEMLSEQFYEHEKLREYEEAAAALAELKDFNKNWSPETVARMEQGLNFAAIQEKLLPTATPVEQENAEKALEILANNQPDLPGLKQEFLKRYLARAEESFEAKDWIKTRQLLDMIEIPYPNTPEAGKLRKSIVDGGQKLLDSAAENARQGKHREAHDLALKAVARWPSAEFQKEASR